jgi:hypothetical protein
MRQFRSRLKALEKALPKHDGMYTLEEMCRIVWRQDTERLRKMTEYSFVRLLIPRFEREDAERRSKRTEAR